MALSRDEVSQKLAALLEEMSSADVHCVVLIALPDNSRQVVSFGLETNATDAVAGALMRAGLEQLGGKRYPMSKAGGILN